MQPLLDAPIGYEVDDGTTHAPLVQATVGGVATRLILDTGSSDHILSAELCAAAGLATEPGEPGTDSTGSSVPSWEARDVAIEIGQVGFAFGEVVVITAPPPFRSGGIGGILSPQRLRPGTHILLDLAGGRVAMLESGDALPDWLSDAFPGWRHLVLPPVDGDGTILVRAAIEPFPPVVTMLDSGAKATYAAQAAVPGLGQGGVPRSTGRGVGGSEAFGVYAPGQTLRVGDATLPVDLLIASHELGLPGCVVGMDLLRGTALVVGGPPGSPVHWLLP